MRIFNRVLAGLSAVTVVAGVAAAAIYRRDMASAHDRVRVHSRILASPYGEVEFTKGGTGPHVLVVHGSGGGFDQEELMVRAVLSDRVHWITPSRFGRALLLFSGLYLFVLGQLRAPPFVRSSTHSRLRSSPYRHGHKSGDKVLSARRASTRRRPRSPEAGVCLSRRRPMATRRRAQAMLNS